jgi:hypothetical protein
MTPRVFETLDTSLQHLNGLPAKIVAVTRRADPTHDEEVLPMYTVEVGGETIEVWSDEIPAAK